MNAKTFLDTNLWVYLYSNDPKGDTIAALIQEKLEDIIISTQVLSECFNVLTRKNLKSAEDAVEIVSDIMADFKVMDIQKATVAHAMKLHIQYRFSYYDSLILASALNANCAIIYTKDMQHGAMIEQNLQILNPFKAVKAIK